MDNSLIFSEDFSPPRTPAPDYPLPPVPTISHDLANIPSCSIEAYRVIQKERQRQMWIEQGIARDIALRESSVQSPVPQPGIDSTSLECIIPQESEGGTPRQRFCLIDLVDDSDAIYGRIKWANDCENSALSVYQRQCHADQLALRFLQHTAYGQSRPFVPHPNAERERHQLKLPELHHPQEIRSEGVETEQRGKYEESRNGDSQKPEGGTGEEPSDKAQESA